MPILIALLGLLISGPLMHLAEAITARRALAAPQCPYCTAPYPPIQWNATLALVTGRGRCPECDKGLRIPRILGELTVAVTWGLLIALYGFNGRTLMAMLAVVPLGMIMVSDLEQKLIPNLITLPALGIMLLLGIIAGPAFPALGQSRWWYTPAGALLGFLILRILVSLGVALFGEGALGEGDITLATYLGATLGFPFILVALVLTFLLGGVGAAAVLVTRRGKLGTAIPYGPFLILGGIITMLWGMDVTRVLFLR